MVGTRPGAKPKRRLGSLHKHGPGTVPGAGDTKVNESHVICAARLWWMYSAETVVSKVLWDQRGGGCSQSNLGFGEDFLENRPPKLNLEG